MNPPLVQRWNARRARYRPAGETIRTTDFEVAPIADDATAKAFVVAHHYAGTYPAARFRYGLYRRGGALVGVAVFSHPTNDRALTNVFPGTAIESVELGRFVLLDEVPGNGETWFLARAFALLRREDLLGVLSFSDPVERRTAAGELVKPGHIGTIYRAHNGRFLGRGAPSTLRLLPDGSILAPRALAKIRSRDRGWRYAAAQLERAGAAPLGEREDGAAWLARWLPALTRTIRHPGNLRYAWALARGVALPEAQPFGEAA